MAQLTEELGNITQEYFYDVFGAARNVKRDPFNRYRFVSLAHDDLTGLIYMNARWYEPSAGRFVSRDPRTGAQMNAQTLNRYGYSSNNPVNLVDRSGLSWWNDWGDFKEEAGKVWDEVKYVADRAVRAVCEAAQDTSEGANFIDMGKALLARRTAGKARAKRQKEEEKAREQGRELDPTSDAVRHCVWACETARSVKDQALVERMMYSHEHVAQQFGDRAQPDDMHNNRVGMRLARGYPGRECEDLCRSSKELRAGW